jgi:hypothetical protein
MERQQEEFYKMDRVTLIWDMEEHFIMNQYLMNKGGK